MIRGKHISLRHVSERDLPLLLEMVNALEKRGEHSSTRLASPHKLRKDFVETGFSSEAFERLLIVDKHDNVIGNVMHFTTRPYTNARELGYIIYKKEARRKGHGTEAVKLLKDYLFDNFPVNRLEIAMNTENVASEKIAKKCGFTKEGTQREIVLVRGQYCDIHLYSLLRKEWKKQRG